MQSLILLSLPILFMLIIILVMFIKTRIINNVNKCACKSKTNHIINNDERIKKALHRNNINLIKCKISNLN